MAISQVIKESQNRLLKFLNFNPETHSIEEVQEKLQRECFPEIDLDQFESISKCYRLIDIENKTSKLYRIATILNDVIDRICFLGDQPETKISSELVLDDQHLRLIVYEDLGDNYFDACYEIILCRREEQMLRWFYKACDDNGDFTEIDQKLRLELGKETDFGYEKSDQIATAIIIGVINEVLSYLDLNYSVARLFSSDFLYLLESSTNIDLIPKTSYFEADVYLFETTEVTNYVSEVKVATVGDTYSTWESFHFYLTKNG